MSMNCVGRYRRANTPNSDVCCAASQTPTMFKPNLQMFPPSDFFGLTNTVSRYTALCRHKVRDV